MLNFSVNTNVGAFLALQNLSQTNQDLGVTQNRINTGLKVASTKDDSATYAIAQSLRADIGGLNAVKSSLDRAQSTLDVAVSAAESISDVLVTMKEKATAASDTGMDEDSRVALQDDFNKLIEQIKSYINSAEFNGSNILTGGATGDKIEALLDTDATEKLTVANLDLNGATGALSKFVLASDADGMLQVDWSDQAGNVGVDDAKQSATDVGDAIDAMKAKLSELGSASRQLTAQQTFVSKLSDTIETGIGNLVDADLAKESAQLQALQTKQQLGLQALSIANQAPQSIMSLFQR
ncbi:flagellin [Pedomonas mirosovicensis]|uniref:flagellin n=1 Tax=Pedomonas mirosovicensis TaxID=2908641 RepID=UPI002169AA06|nr:flagellin [Pedomonas mirosovicensis]MCH8685090.1 flagellin [Pedomonas mirosovicensis]